MTSLFTLACTWWRAVLLFFLITTTATHFGTFLQEAHAFGFMGGIVVGGVHKSPNTEQTHNATVTTTTTTWRAWAIHHMCCKYKKCPFGSGQIPGAVITVISNFSIGSFFCFPQIINRIWKKWFYFNVAVRPTSLSSGRYWGVATCPQQPSSTSHLGPTREEKKESFTCPTSAVPPTSISLL